MFKLIKTQKTVNSNLIKLYCSQPTNGKNILILAGTHGDEPQGVQILELFVNEKRENKNNIFVIPCLNPDGYKNKTRVNTNGVDLNRNFPTQNWAYTERNEFFGGETPASEIETKFMVNILEEINPDLILTIHAPFKIVNFDGNAQNISNDIAQIINYPIQADIGYPTPGSFGTYCGIEKNIPTITLELGEDESFAHQKTRCFKIFEYLANQI